MLSPVHSAYATAATLGGLLLLLLLVLLAGGLKRWQRLRLPGPPRLPLLGSYPFIQLPYRRWLAEATRRYGGVFAFRLAGKTWVSLNTYEAIHAALATNGEALSGRPQGLWSKKIFRGSGLVLGEGPLWQKHRKFVLKVFREVGFRKLNLESVVQDELQHCLAELVTEKSVVSGDFFSSITCNVTYRIIFGLRATDDEGFSERLKAVQTIVQRDVYATFSTAVLMPIFLVFPSLLFYLVKEIRAAQLSIETLLTFIENRIVKTGQAYNRNYEPAAFIEAVVNSKGLSSGGDFSEGKLAVTVFDLLLGGTDTTSSCLQWIFLHLATRPDYQEQLASGLIATLGSRQATFADCRRLPQLSALIAEVQRLHPPLPTAINHRVKSDISVCGFAIPRDTWVFPNLRAAHRDPRVFRSPDKFNPARFIAPDGSCQVPQQLVTFSVGARACPGERLAQMQISLVAAELLRRYRVRLADGDSNRPADDLMTGSDGLVSAPGPYGLVFESRVV